MEKSCGILGGSQHLVIETAHPGPAEGGAAGGSTGFAGMTSLVQGWGPGSWVVLLVMVGDR